MAKVPLVGDTWYERGGLYWLRRTLMVLCCGPVVVVLITALVDALNQLHRTSVLAFWIVLGVEVASSLAIIIGVIVSIARRWNEPYPPKRGQQRPRTVLSRMLRPFVLSAQLLVGAVAVLSIGTYVLLFIAMLTPQTVWERHARLRMAERIRQLPLDTAAHAMPTGPLRGMAKRLAEGPTLLISPDQTEKLTTLVAGYAPDARHRRRLIIMGNGVILHGPVHVSTRTATDAGLPDPTAIAYYATGAAASGRRRRPVVVKTVESELLVRGLAARLPAARYSIRPWSPVELRLSVYAERPAPVERVVATLQPFAGDRQGRELHAEPHESIPDAYLIFSETEPPFVVSFSPNRFFDSLIDPAPVALGRLCQRQPCRWQLRVARDAAATGADIRILLGNAAFALADAVEGVVIDTFGFQVTSAKDVVAG